MRGINPIISIMVLLLIVISLVGASWSFISGYYEGMVSKVISIMPACLSHNEGEVAAYIQNIGTDNINLPEPSEVPFKDIKNLVVNPGFENEDEEGNPEGWHVSYPVDAVLVTDRSGSMRQSGWSLINESLPAEGYSGVSVPKDGWSETREFSAGPDTERIAVAITWEEIPAYPGSGGSELAVNLQRPDGTWIFSYPGRPDGPPDSMDAGDTVDPGGDHEIGYDTEYYNGISTRPQVLLVENSTDHPIEGIWHVSVYGWNLRPKNLPPDSIDVNIDVFRDMEGPGDDINKTDTIIAIDAAKDAAKYFLNQLKTIDQAAYVKFGSYGVLAQGLTGDFDLVRAAINDTGLEGGTAIDTGTDEAVSELVNNGRSNALPVAILLTDGQNDNGGDIVLNSAGVQAAISSNIPIYTIGLTYFADEVLLGQIANNTGGKYYSAPDPGSLYDIYRDIAREITWKRSYQYRVYGYYSMELVGGEGNQFASDYRDFNSSCNYMLSQYIRREIINGTFSVQLELYDGSYALLDTIILGALADSGEFAKYSYNIDLESYPDTRYVIIMYRWLADSVGRIWMDDVFLGPELKCTGSGKTYTCGDLVITKTYGDGDIYPYFDLDTIAPQKHATFKDINCEEYCSYKISAYSNMVDTGLKC